MKSIVVNNGLCMLGVQFPLLGMITISIIKLLVRRQALFHVFHLFPLTVFRRTFNVGTLIHAVAW
jgi:hypothetical protein